MKRLWIVLLLGACGTRLNEREVQRWRAVLGVSASELENSAQTERLDAVAHDLRATDAATHQLGEVECGLLQTRARALGRETAAALPVLPAADRSHLDQVSAELQGAVQCAAGFPFDADRLARTLTADARAVQQALQRARRGGG